MFRGFFQKTKKGMKDNKNDTDSDKKELEKHELNRLIARGFYFDLERFVCVRGPGILGLLGKRKKQSVMERHRVQEPTLAVLDLIAAEQIELVIDEKLMTSEDALCIARKLAKQHARRMAKIVALAVLGEDYIKATQVGARVKYEHDDKRLDELTDLFFSRIKPSRLTELVSMISAMSNLGDFTNSIRLMSAARTTMPILVEEKLKG